MGFSFVLLENIGSPNDNKIWGYDAKLYYGGQWMIEDDLGLYKVVIKHERDKFTIHERTFSQQDFPKREFKGTLEAIDRQAYSLVKNNIVEELSLMQYAFRRGLSLGAPSTMGLTIASQENVPILDITRHAKEKIEHRYLNFLLNDLATKEIVQKAIGEIK